MAIVADDAVAGDDQGGRVGGAGVGITVFIGANSSGKSNLLDALYFLRDITTDGVPVALQNRGGVNKVRIVQLSSDPEPTELEIVFKRVSGGSAVTYNAQFKFENPLSLIPKVVEQLYDGDRLCLRSGFEPDAMIGDPKSDKLVLAPYQPDRFGQTALWAYGRVPSYEPIHLAYQYITQRWQMLDENFMPPVTISYPTDERALWVIDRCADNLPLILDFMAHEYPELFGDLQADLGWLLGYVRQLELQTNGRETQLLIHEQALPGSPAPTISAGTARLLAMLTAYYLLEVRDRDLPGLVVLEEPDTALNPWLLERFVDQLRGYTSGDSSRQFILTTHNPRLLDYFDPAEIRIVNRDEMGFTTVNTVPTDITDIWLDEFGLGEVWTTGSIGGVPN